MDESHKRREGAMGIYDRDYYREGNGGFRFGAPSCPTVVTLGVIYVLLFLIQQFTRERVNPQDIGVSPFTATLRMDTAKLLDGEIWRAFTYAYTPPPNDLFPLLCVILFLVLFARHVENEVGSPSLARLAALAGLLAAVSKVMIDIALGLPQPTLLGPGAVITAIMTLYAILNPRRIVYLIIIPLPAWMLPLLCIAIDLTLSRAGFHGGLIASHAGGVLAAFAIHALDSGSRERIWRRSSRRRRETDLYHTLEPATNYPPPVRTSDAGGPAAASATLPATEPGIHLDEHTEAKMDELLEKVNNHGWNSLSDAERELLKRASEILKRKRDTK